jgi:hypothetical protein
MAALSKAVLLSLLLVFAGVQGNVSQLCAERSGSHAHACCKAHEQVSTANREAPATSLGSLSCCKVAPDEPVAPQAIVLSTGSHHGSYQLDVNRVETLRVQLPTSGKDSGSPRLKKLLHSPVHAVLCTFLV